MHQIDVRYTEPLVRAAVNAFFWRTLRRRFGLSGVFALVVTLIALGFLVLGGDRSWVVGFAGACVLFVVLVFAAGYIAHYRNTTGRLERMARPEARFVFTDADLSVTSDVGSASLAWSSVREVWAFPKFWLFLLSRSQFLTLPIEGAGEDVLALIRSKTTVS
jgi:hypothetical protein